MPKNKFGGCKAKKGKNHQQPKELILKESNEQQYAKVTKILGNCRLEVLCIGDQVIRLAHIRGKLRKRAWINLDDIILISIREFQDNKCDVINKYSSDEVKILKNLKELESNVDTKVKEEEICSFDFDEI